MDFEITSIVSQNSFSHVFTGLLDNDEKVIVKKKSQEWDFYENELMFSNILDKIDPTFNIHLPIKLIKKFDKSVWIVYKKLHLDLFDFYYDKIRDSTIIPLISNHLYQVIEMVATLHSFGCIHGDLKLENIMTCDEEGKKIILIDFDFATQVSQNEEFHVNTGKNHKFDNILFGTLHCLHPDIIAENPFSLFVHDIWCIIVMSIMLFTNTLYKNYSWVIQDNWHEKLLDDEPSLENQKYYKLFILYINKLRQLCTKPYCLISTSLLTDEFLLIWKD